MQASYSQPRSAEERYHYTTDIVDDAIRWLSTQRSLAPHKPYFLYLATGAAHGPHHVPTEWIEHYRGKFDQGWDRLREQIFDRQKSLGVVPMSAELPPQPKELPRWRNLTTQQRRVAAREMEIYAAFISHTDHEIGRLISGLRSARGGDNTLILYVVGDNGAGAEALNGGDLSTTPVGLAQHTDEPGPDGSVNYWNYYSAGWRLAANTPF